METNFLEELNEDLENGRPTSKSKKPDLVPEIATALHIASERRNVRNHYKKSNCGC